RTPVGVGIAAERALAQEVRLQQVERAAVGHRRPDTTAHADAVRVPVEPAERGYAAASGQRVPPMQVVRGRAGGDRRLWIAQPAEGLLGRAPALRGIGREAP